MENCVNIMKSFVNIVKSFVNAHVLNNHIWIRIFVIIFIAIILIYCLHLSYNFIKPRLLQRNLFITNALLKSLHLPVMSLILVGAVIEVARLVASRFFANSNIYLEDMPRVSTVGMVLFLAWICIRAVKSVEKLLVSGKLTKNRPDATMIQAGGKLLRFIFVFIFIFASLHILGAPTSSAFVFGGSVGISLGFAARKVLSNYFGGLFIYADGHFKVGDFIYSPDKDIAGTVESIDWRSTRVRTLDKRPSYIPNSLFSSIVVVNSSRMTNWHITSRISVRHKDGSKLKGIINEIKGMLHSNEKLDHKLPMMVFFTEIGQYSLDILIDVFTITKIRIEHYAIKQEIYFGVIEIIERNGAKLALPSQSIEMKETSLDSLTCNLSS